MRVGAAEDDGGGGERGGGLAGEVGARVVPVDAVRLPRRRHVLGPLPAVVVRVAVPHLSATHAQAEPARVIAINGRFLQPRGWIARVRQRSEQAGKQQ
jgi:hypothetical protein